MSRDYRLYLDRSLYMWKKRNNNNNSIATSIPERKIPRYAWICISIIAATMFIVFYGTKLAIAHRTLHILTGPIDDKIPFVPAWITVYYFAFISWLSSGLWIMIQGKEHAYKTTIAAVIAISVSGVVFLLWPGTLQRPEVTGQGIFERLVRLTYQLDSPTDLCPSLHVLYSFICWRGIIGCKNIPRWAKWFNFILLILVCNSILFVKQHAIVDIIPAFLIGELAFRAVEKWHLQRILYRIFPDKEPVKSDFKVPRHCPEELSGK